MGVSSLLLVTNEDRFPDAAVHRSPFFAMHMTQDVQGYLEGLDQVNGEFDLWRAAWFL